MAMEQGMPPAADGGAAGAPGGSDQFTQLVSNIADGMAMLTEVLATANPDAGAELDGISKAFQSVVEKAMSGGAGPAPQGQGMASAQAGVAKAVPAGPQGVARG